MEASECARLLQPHGVGLRAAVDHYLNWLKDHKHKAAPVKSQFSPEYRAFLAPLVKARKDAGLTQGEAAKRYGKPQSFISKCESGERRVDVVEQLRFGRIYHVDAVKIVPSLDQNTG